MRRGAGILAITSDVNSTVADGDGCVHVDSAALPAAQTQQEVFAARILVVDDDEAVHRLASAILTLAGYQVLVANNGAEAVQLCEQEETPVDLVLADVVMPKLSGRQMASQIASFQPSVKVLLMSGYPNVSGLLNGIASRSEKVKADCDFIQKPFTPVELIRRVREKLCDQTDLVR